MAQNCGVLGAMALTQACFVFTEGDIEHPMQGVLDAPVAAFVAQQLGGTGFATGDVVAPLYGNGSAAAAFQADHHHGGQVGKVGRMAQTGEHFGVADRPGCAPFKAAMAFVERGGVVVGIGPVATGDQVGKQQHHIVVELALVGLQR